MSAPVLVINSGSSSIKYQLVDGDTMEASTSGLIERIGQSASLLTHRHAGERHEREGRLADHAAGLEAMVAAFEEHGTPLSTTGLIAVAHRVVHGGERFVQPVIVDDEVEQAIEDLSALAPLHNPANLEGIRVARKLFPKLPQVAVFDTAFHATVPERAHLYAVPASWREDHGVRRYGFHGTSHAYVSRKAAEMLGRSPKEVNVIVAHLGNGASVTAVERGRSIDTSMGLTPLEGLVMGTRSGDIDPAIVFHMHRRTGASFADLDTALNKESGMYALTGQIDMRAIEAAAAAGDRAAQTALEIYCYRIRKYIGSYIAALGGADAIAFTAGVGENSAEVRAGALGSLVALGVQLDEAANAAGGPIISTPDSPITVMVVPTNEEGEIAGQTAALLRS
ncbi:acetate kinase [Glycomyces sp. TRM65418]|uniref:acetate/propionate family kinase n=1 Tax=Glycomyces sp. TRM65418 TaxID=2867006 RepID=UPI001CE70744|nr:acetate kinase [Glycomyces sp. TRM65418]MCC3761870.1 acetate kinase [Glycomyces sp. TRM65418]QZD55951.1 acetate kinase [Glycomyces sp. TRM65418]